MLMRCLQSVLSTCQAVSVRFEPLPEPPYIDLPRPVWDNGTDYDIPTFIRLSGNARRAAVRRPGPLARSPIPVGRWAGPARPQTVGF